MPELNFNNNVFINCPFDENYKSLLKMLIFTIIHCGYNPRISLESSDSSISRLEKIQNLIHNAKYSIHDISRCKASRKGEYYRLNMPFEIGLDFGCKKYGNSEQQEKEILILSSDPYHYQKALSDLSGVDIMVHKNDNEEMVRRIREWLYTKKSTIKQPTTIWDDYNAFIAYLEEDLKEKDIKNMAIPEYIDKAKEYIRTL